MADIVYYRGLSLGNSVRKGRPRRRRTVEVSVGAAVRASESLAL